MKCKMTKKIQDYLDGTLSFKENSYFEEHLKICNSCKGEYTLMKEIFAEFRKLRESSIVLSKDITPLVMGEVYKITPVSKFYLNSKYFITGLLLFSNLIFISLFHQKILNILIFRGLYLIIKLFTMIGIILKIFLNSFIYIIEIMMNNIQENFLLYFILQISAFFFTFIFAEVLTKNKLKEE